MNKLNTNQKDTPINILENRDVKVIFHMLNKNGYEAFIVGGCVRDCILGRECHDIDFCTNATPEEIKECFKSFKTIDTGIKHGTVTILIYDKSYEITTYRIDGKYSDSRHPDSVRFTCNIGEDLKRRDFTINAIAVNQNCTMAPKGALDDISKRIIRCVGNPEERFKEDPLRIIRALRFYSQLYSFSMDEETNKAIYKLYNELDHVSIERITSEFNKIIMSSNAGILKNKYNMILFKFIPELKKCEGFNQNNPHHNLTLLDHMFSVVDHIRVENGDLITRLAGLLHDVAKPDCYLEDENGIGHFYNHSKESADIARNILKRCKYDNKTINQVCELICYHEFSSLTKSSIKRIINKIGTEQFIRLLLLKKADILSQSDFNRECKLNDLLDNEILFQQILNDKECFSIKNLAINGNDLKRELNIPEGKAIGLILNDLLSKVINNELKNTRDDLIARSLAYYKAYNEIKGREKCK